MYIDFRAQNIIWGGNYHYRKVPDEQNGSVCNALTICHGEKTKDGIQQKTAALSHGKHRSFYILQVLRRADQTRTAWI